MTLSNGDVLNDSIVASYALEYIKLQEKFKTEKDTKKKRWHGVALDKLGIEFKELTGMSLNMFMSWMWVD